MIGNELKRFHPEQRYALIDCETTGLNLFASRPWQIAWLIADAKQVYEREVWYPWFPDLNVSRQAALVTRFNWEEYKAKAVPPAQVLARLDERIYDPSIENVVGHNFFYDGHIRNVLRRACGLKPDNAWMHKLVDTNCLSKAYRKGLKPDLSNFLAWQYKMTSIRERLKTRLGTMCVELGVEFDDKRAHEAMYDCEKNRELYEKLKYVVEF